MNLQMENVSGFQQAKANTASAKNMFITQFHEHRKDSAKRGKPAQNWI